MNGDFIHKLHDDHKRFSHSLPDKHKAEQFINKMVQFLFPVVSHQEHTSGHLGILFERLKTDYNELLLPLIKLTETKPEVNTAKFFDALPDIYELLRMDAKAIFRFDPAASCMEEVIMAYPGFYAIAVFRLSHAIHACGVPILPRILSEYAHSKTGIDIHPGAVIGESFFIDHGTGIVIGETSIIGKNVKIYQGVTLGALSVKKTEANMKRHPTIEDNVIIYSGSTILGGDTVIGHDSVIGGNVWLTESVIPYSLVYHKSEIRVRNHNTGKNDSIDFTI